MLLFSPLNDQLLLKVDGGMKDRLFCMDVSWFIYLILHLILPVAGSPNTGAASFPTNVCSFERTEHTIAICRNVLSLEVTVIDAILVRDLGL